MPRKPKYKKTLTQCEVCRHGVWDMKKHEQTEEHKRNLRRSKE